MSRRVPITLALVVPLLAGAAVGGYYFLAPHEPHAEEAPARLAQRGNITVTLPATLAESYGIRAAPAVAAEWREPHTVYGRVVPNPQATAEVRAPLAGTVKPAPGRAWPKLGEHLAAREALGLLDARLTPQERIDLRAKSAEAEAKFHGAEKSVAIQEERMRRLEGLSASGTSSQRELDAARLQLLDARTQREAAGAQWQIYRQALAAPAGQGVTLPLAAELEGDVAELAAQPGQAVEPGAVLFKVVDFRHALVRLDFPLAQAQGPVPPEVDAAPAGVELGQSPVLAHFTGAAPQVDAGSQRAALLYRLEAPPGAAWRPGLFVKATYPDPTVAPRAAVAIPATALLYHQGRSLVYVQLRPGRFERREVHVLGRHGDVLVVAGGVRPGELVVCEQAQVILSEEFRRDTDDDD